MPANSNVQQTNRFSSRSPVIAASALALIAIAGIGSTLLRSTVVKQTFAVSPEASTQLSPIPIKKRLVGALRIDVTASLPVNHWVTYEVSLLDPQGTPIASAIKQSWRDFSQEDLQGGLDVRAVAQQTESVTIELSVVKHGDTAGNDVTAPVSFQVVVQDGVIDTRYLWAGGIATLILAGISFLSVGQSGAIVIDRAINDSDVGGRAAMGGPDSLILATVKITSDESSPSMFWVDFYVKDSNGQQIYYHKFSVNRRSAGEDVFKQTLQVYLMMKRRSSYGFYVEVIPDGPIDRTQLIVRNDVRTRGAVDVVQI